MCAKRRKVVDLSASESFSPILTNFISNNLLIAATKATKNYQQLWRPVRKVQFRPPKPREKRFFHHISHPVYKYTASAPSVYSINVFIC